MKTYEFDGKKFTQKLPSLAVEHRWVQFAIDDEGRFNKSAFNEVTRDPESLQWFMTKLLEGDHSGVDWYNDAPSDIVGEVFADFFTRWSERTIKALDMLSAGSEEKPSSQSVEESPQSETAS